MQLFGNRVFEEQKAAGRVTKSNAGQRLRAVTAVMLTLAAGVPPGFAQQQQSGGVTGGGEKPPEQPRAPLPAISTPSSHPAAEPAPDGSRLFEAVPTAVGQSDQHVSSDI